MARGCFFSAVLILFLVLAGASAESWSQWRYDVTRVGAAANTAPSNISFLNYYTTGGAVWSSPVVSGGSVYIGSNDDVLYQLNATNVSHVIATQTLDNAIQSSPAVSGGFVYVGTNSGTVYQLNATDVGADRLTGGYAHFHTGGGGWDVYSSPAVSGGSVYVGSSDGLVYQLNASNVSVQVANFSTGGAVYCSPSVSGGSVYIGSNDDKLYRLNASNVSQQFENYTTFGDISYYAPAVNGTYVYITSDDGALYQLNASNVSQLIAKYIPPSGFLRSAPALSGGYIYVGNSDKKLYQLNASNVSQLIATYLSGDQIRSAPAVVGGYVFFGSKDNKLYQLTTGMSFVNNYSTGGEVWSSPAVANGYVYVGSFDGKVYQFTHVPNFTTAPTIIPAVAYTGTQLNCTWTLQDDMDALFTVDVTWYRNNSANHTFDVTGISCANATTCGTSVNVTGTIKGQIWICSVKAVNSHFGSTGYTNGSSLTISNTAPVITSKLLVVNNVNGSLSLTMNVSASDIDGASDLGYAIFGTNFSAFSGGEAVISLNASLSQVGTLTVNDSSGATDTYAFNFSVTNNGLAQDSSPAHSLSSQTVYMNDTVHNGHAVNALNCSINFSAPAGGVMSFEKTNGSVVDFRFQESIAAGGDVYMFENWTGDWLTTYGSYVQDASNTSVFGGVAYSLLNASEYNNGSANFSNVNVSSLLRSSWACNSSLVNFSAGANKTVIIYCNASSVLINFTETYANDLSEQNGVNTTETYLYVLGSVTLENLDALVNYTGVLWNQTAEANEHYDFADAVMNFSSNVTTYSNITVHPKFRLNFTGNSSGPLVGSCPAWALYTDYAIFWFNDSYAHNVTGTRSNFTYGTWSSAQLKWCDLPGDNCSITDCADWVDVTFSQNGNWATRDASLSNETLSTLQYLVTWIPAGGGGAPPAGGGGGGVSLPWMACTSSQVWNAVSAKCVSTDVLDFEPKSFTGNGTQGEQKTLNVLFTNNGLVDIKVEVLPPENMLAVPDTFVLSSNQSQTVKLSFTLPLNEGVTEYEVKVFKDGAYYATLPMQFTASKGQLLGIYLGDWSAITDALKGNIWGGVDVWHVVMVGLGVVCLVEWKKNERSTAYFFLFVALAVLFASGALGSI